MARNGGIPKIILGGMKENAGRRVDERLGREASEAADLARQRIEVLQPMTVDFPSTALASGKTMLRLDAVSEAGHVARPFALAPPSARARTLHAPFILARLRAYSFSAVICALRQKATKQR